MKHTYINDETLKAHYWNTDGFSLKFPQQRHDRCFRNGQGGTASIPSSPIRLSGTLSLHLLRPWRAPPAPGMARPGTPPGGEGRGAGSGHGEAGRATGRGRAGSWPSHRGVKEWRGREKEWRASHRGVNARFLVVSCNILQCSAGCFESSIEITTEISNNN